MTGILPLAKKSLSNEVMIFMCMLSKADKPCNSKHVVKVSFVRLYVSFVQLFLSNITITYGVLFRRGGVGKRKICCVSCSRSYAHEVGVNGSFE